MVATPPKATTLECDPLLRIFLADFNTREHLDIAIEQVRVDASAILDVGRAAGAEYLAGTAPFQDQVHVRALVLRLNLSVPGSVALAQHRGGR